MSTVDSAWVEYVFVCLTEPTLATPCLSFVLSQADKKADLSCGTLYAARLEAVGEVTASQANYAVKWIKLGYGESCSGSEPLTRDTSALTYQHAFALVSYNHGVCHPCKLAGML